MFYLTKLRQCWEVHTQFGIEMEQAVYHPPEDEHEAAWIWLGAGLACLAAAVFGEAAVSSSCCTHAAVAIAYLLLVAASCCFLLKLAAAVMSVC